MRNDLVYKIKLRVFLHIHTQGQTRLNKNYILFQQGCTQLFKKCILHEKTFFI